MENYLVATEHSSAPILIIDREGSIGNVISVRLKEYVQIVLVSNAEPVEKHNLLFLPFTKQPPHIPDEQYSHIFLVVQTEKEVEDFTPSLAKKAEESKGKLIVVVPKKIASTKVLSLLQQSGKEVFVLLIGDLFGGVVLSQLKSSIEKIFTTAKKTKTLNLAGMGMQQLYPVDFNDVVIEIIRVSFGRPAGRFFFLFPKQGVTELGIAHAIQKIDPLIKIDFRKGDIPQENSLATSEGEYLLADTYPTIERIQKAYETFIAPPETEEKKFWGEDEEKYTVPTKKGKFIHIFWSVVIFSFFLAMLPGVIMVVAGGIGFFSLLQAKTPLLNGNFVQVSTAVKVSQQAFVVSENAGRLMENEIGVISPSLLDTPLSIIATGKDLSQNIQTLVTTMNQMQLDVKSKLVTKDTVQKMISNVKISILGIENEINTSIIPINIKDSIAQKLTEFSPVMNTLDLLPTVAGFYGKKTYLVIFQNNMELRPGGGFIGSYGQLTLNKGTVESFTIHNVYDADGLLKGHVEPPFPIRRFVQVHLYLRDSNFSIDFAKNAYVAALLFHQETGTTVDGVISVDLSFVKNILKVVGSVRMPTYNQTVTADNFFLLTETHAEKDSFAGSTQKQDFLQSFFTSLEAKFEDSKNISLEELAQAVLTSIEEKHVQVAFNDTGAEDLAVANSLASTLWDSRKQEANGVNDLLSVNEANLGFNKVNYYINRTISQDVVIHDDGKITGTVVASYTNTDTNGAWPGGPYKNYLRFFLPQGATLEKIFIDGVEQTLVPAVTSPADYEAKGFVPPKGLEVEKADEGDSTYYGILVQVQPGLTEKITALYSLAQSIDITQPVFSYSQWFLKQPGTDTYPVTFSVTIPSGYKILQSSNLQVDNSVLSFSNNLTKDTYFSFRAGKE